MVLLLLMSFVLLLGTDATSMVLRSYGTAADVIHCVAGTAATLYDWLRY